MGPPWARCKMNCAQIFLLLLLLLEQEPSYAINTPIIAKVIEVGHSTVFKHSVEVDIGGKVVYRGAAIVEASRYNADTLLIFTTKDPHDEAEPLVTGDGLGRAVVVKTLAGRVNSLLHHPEEDGVSLNYKRALASLLTPALHSSSLSYHTQSDVLGTCEVHYKHSALTTTTWRDLTRCSHFTSESVLGAHSLPLLHLGFDVLGSESQCDYRWRGAHGGVLEGTACVESLNVAPRYVDETQVLNITVSSTLSHTASAPYSSSTLDYLQEATEVTDLAYHIVQQDDESAASNASGLLKEICSSDGEGRITSHLLQKLLLFSSALARSTSSALPHLTSTCPLPIRRLVSSTAAIVGGPRALQLFISQIAEFALLSEKPFKYGEEFLFTLALKSLLSSSHPSAASLPVDYFARRENQMVYEELIDYLLNQEPPAVAGVATLLEGLKEGAPQLFERLLEKSSPYLSPAEACEDGQHAEAVRVMRVTSGLTSRPFGYVASMRPCFETDDVGVAVAAMDTLTNVDCDIQGVTELQKLGLESPSDPEIRIAAYRSLFHCLVERPTLLQVVANALDPTHDLFSTQVASYIWSHVQTVLTSDDPSQIALKDLLMGSKIVAESNDPVWYDPRQHSRHISHTINVDARTAVTASLDLVWGRYSPAPRAIYLKVALHHDGETYEVAKMMLRVTGLERMLLSFPGAKTIMDHLSKIATDLVSTVTSLAQQALRTKRGITHIQIADFIEHVMSRIPSDYRSGISSIELSLSLIGNHAFHIRLSDLHNKSLSETLGKIMHGSLETTILGLMPLLDNTFSMTTLSGVPVSLAVSGIGSIYSLFEHDSSIEGGTLQLLTSGGIAAKTQVLVGRSQGQGQIWDLEGVRSHPVALASDYLWSLDFPYTASYENKGEEQRVTIHAAKDWTGKFWQNYRYTSVAGDETTLRTIQDCYGVDEPLEVCIDNMEVEKLHRGEDTESTEDLTVKSLTSGWLSPYSSALYFKNVHPSEPIILTITSPRAPGILMHRAIIEVEGQGYEVSFVLQNTPTPTLALTMNSPAHTYLLKGYAGSRESVTQMAGIDIRYDAMKYGVRVQLSTPILDNQRVWSPSVFVITPEGGEEEALRSFLSIKQTRDESTTELSFQTLGPLVEYLNFDVAVETSWSISQLDGSIRSLEVKELRFDNPSKLKINTDGKVHFQRRDGEASVTINFGENEGEIELEFSVRPVVQFLGASPHGLVGLDSIGDGGTGGGGGGGGSTVSLSLALRHNQLPEVVHTNFRLLRDKNRVDTSLSFHLSESGGFNISHISNGPFDFKTSASVNYIPLDITWGGEHEILVREDEFRHFMKVSWSPRTHDYASSLVHYTNHNMLTLDRSLKLVLVYPGQVIEIENSMAEARGGSVKNKLEVRMDPGQTILMDTVIIYRNEPGMFSYGLSNTFKLDTWISPVSIVATVNCIGLAKCTLALSAVQAGDQLADVELEYTSAAGISRSDAKIVIMGWFDGSVSLDTVPNIGYYDLKWELALKSLNTLVLGHAEADLSSTEIATMQMFLQELVGDVIGDVTSAYNATLSYNPDMRALYSRQEARMIVEGTELLWIGVVQGRVGDELLNNHHFGKATLVTPTAMYYTASGDINSEVLGLESVIAGVSFSAGAGPEASYLLSWDLKLRQPNVTRGSSILDVGTIDEEDLGVVEEKAENSGDLLNIETHQEYPLEIEGQRGRNSLTLQTMLRGNSPITGEIKLKVKARKTDYPKDVEEDFGGGAFEQREVKGGNVKYDADIRLISESYPEMGRIHGSLTQSTGIYSLNGRVWSGPRSFAVVSYGLSNNESLKSSHSAVLVDPNTFWRRVEVKANADHLGWFPFNFQTSLDSRVVVNFEEMGAMRALGQWTPFVSAVDLGFRSYFQDYPRGNIYYKFSSNSMQSSVGWKEMKAMSLIQWAEQGHALQLALNYDNPGMPFNDLDAIITFALSKAPYPPVSLALNGRVSVNGFYHYIVNVDCRSQQEQYFVTGALVRPGGSGSLRLQLKKAGVTYGALGALVIDSFSGQISGTFTQLSQGEDLRLNIHSSFLEDAKGYSFRFARKFDDSKGGEVALIFSQAGEEPQWIYTYKLLLEIERDIKSKLRRLRVEDHFTYDELDELLLEYNFLILVVHNKYDEMEIEIEFPDIWSKVKVAGTVVKGKDSQIDLVLVTPSIKHLLEGRLIFGSDSWWSSHSGSLSYSQQGKKGRGQPFKLEVDGSKWNTDRQKYKLSMQRMIDEFKAADYKVEEKAHHLNEAGIFISNFDASLDVSRDPGSADYKISWETDGTKNLATLLLEDDQSGGKGLLRYMIEDKSRPKSQVEYEVKGNYRQFDTEVMVSATLDHTHLGRPRAISFLHSDPDGYTELVLDLFREEGDQVILVFIYLPENFRIRVGQYGNTFLQVGYQKTIDDEDVTHGIQLESSGRILELWVASSPDGALTCRKGGITLQTPSLAPTHNALAFCPGPSSELTLQVLGVEEHEGPYLRVGQISGPGGVGIQVGSGRLIPLDTPPALTLTADIEEEILEVKVDWQSPSIAQLKEEVTSRGTSLLTAVEDLGEVEIHVQGSLDLMDLLNETQRLLQEAEELLRSAANHVMSNILDGDSEFRLGNLVTISISKVLEYLESSLDIPLTILENWMDKVSEVLDEFLDAVEGITSEIIEECSYILDDLKQSVTEFFDDFYSYLDEALKPPILRVQAALQALAINDDQSLYALVSRVMGEVRSRSGRGHGILGFIHSNVLTRIEKWLATMARWDEVKETGTELLQSLGQVTTFDVTMPHSKALKLRASMPSKFVEDSKEAASIFLDDRLPDLIVDSREWMDNQWARVRYLFSWHVRGESVVFGWDQAITWDGRQVMPMLTDSCHHMLALLINARTPTAVTIHLKDLETHPRKVFTFFSGTDRVTIDSNLMMTYNNQHVRRPNLVVGELTLSWYPGRASVQSSAGLSLECEDQLDTCRLEVAWENFAATAGLLGVFDFDNNTDFMTSGWDLPATEEEWAQSWRVASLESCSSALPESDIFLHPENECSMLFDDPQSPFRSCFSSIPPSPYLEACRTGWACGAESAYMHACDRHYHELENNLTSCNTCDLEGIKELGTDGLPHEVVIITDFDCLEDMQDLINALVKDQQSNYRVMLRYIGRGTPSYGPFDNVVETVVDSATAPLDAVANAVFLDFSQRALKSIVLFDCDHPMCTVSMTSPKILELRDALLRQGVQLHLVTQDPLLILQQDALSNKSKRQLIGLDAKTTYTMSHARKRHVRGKRRLREHVTVPMGNTCADMAVQSDGSVFSLHQLKIDRKYHRKIYQQLLAARVREGQNAQYLTCRRCECDVPCSLCNPPSPFQYSKPSRDSLEDDDDEEDYDDEEEEPRSKKKKKKKKSHRGRRN